MTTIQTTTLRPGLLVSLKTSVVGGVEYQRTDLEREHDTDTGTRRARWETTREIEDPAEFEDANKARAKVATIVRAVCAPSDFGLLCPESRAADLADAIARARAVADGFNARARRSSVRFYVITGRIASDDVEAARAIGAEVRTLVDIMRAGVAAADPEAIRDAANRARKLGAMLAPEVAGKVTAAIEEARTAAREIARRVTKGGEAAAAVVAEIRIDALRSDRFAALDLDGAGEVAAAAPAPVSAALDLPAAETAPAAPPAAPAGWDLADGGDLTPPAPAAPAALDLAGEEG